MSKFVFVTKRRPAESPIEIEVELHASPHDGTVALTLRREGEHAPYTVLWLDPGGFIELNYLTKEERERYGLVEYSPAIQDRIRVDL